MAKIGVQCALARRLSGRHGLFPHPDVELKPRTYSVKRTPIGRSILTVFCIVWIALLLSRYGPCPIGGDPELMYKPIKSELKRSLDVGRLPFWSNRFGVGVPLVAESHVAAFYPPNWLLYRLFNVELAYKMAMWLHWLALAVTTFAYARFSGITRAGSALAAIIFSLCGFQAVHIVHEPFNHLMPYLPLCLLLADGFMQTGKIFWLAGLCAGVGHAAYHRAFSNPDVDSRAGPLVRCVADLECRDELAAHALANWRPVRGSGLGSVDRLGPAQTDLGAYRRGWFRAWSSHRGTDAVSAGALGSICLARGLPRSASRYRRQVLGALANALR